MNSSLIIKSLIALSVVGGIATGSAYALIPSNLKNEITTKLIENKYEILSDNLKNKSKWDAIIDSYKKLAERHELKFENLTGNENDAVNKLQAECNKLLKDESKTNLVEIDYKKAEKWCVEPITISSILQKRNIKALNWLDSDTETNKSEWQSKITKHRKNQIAIEKLDGLSIGTDGNITDEHIKNIKAKCKSVGDQKNHEDKFDLSLKLFKSWCAS